MFSYVPVFPFSNSLSFSVLVPLLLLKVLFSNLITPCVTLCQGLLVLLCLSRRGKRHLSRSPLVVWAPLVAISHASAAFVGSLSQSTNISAAILNHTPTSPYLDSALSLLAVTANRPNWSDIKDIDVPIRQRQLSRAIDQASIDLLLQDVPNTRSKALHDIIHPYPSCW